MTDTTRIYDTTSLFVWRSLANFHSACELPNGVIIETQENGYFIPDVRLEKHEGDKWVIVSRSRWQVDQQALLDRITPTPLPIQVLY